MSYRKRRGSRRKRSAVHRKKVVHRKSSGRNASKKQKSVKRKYFRGRTKKIHRGKLRGGDPWWYSASRTGMEWFRKGVHAMRAEEIHRRDDMVQKLVYFTGRAEAAEKKAAEEAEAAAKAEKEAVEAGEAEAEAEAAETRHWLAALLQQEEMEAKSEEKKWRQKVSVSLHDHGIKIPEDSPLQNMIQACLALSDIYTARTWLTLSTILPKKNLDHMIENILKCAMLKLMHKWPQDRAVAEDDVDAFISEMEEEEGAVCKGASLSIKEMVHADSKTLTVKYEEVPIGEIGADHSVNAVIVPHRRVFQEEVLVFLPDGIHEHPTSQPAAALRRASDKSDWLEIMENFFDGALVYPYLAFSYTLAERPQHTTLYDYNPDEMVKLRFRGQGLWRLVLYLDSNDPLILDVGRVSDKTKNLKYTLNVKEKEKARSLKTERDQRMAEREARASQHEPTFDPTSASAEEMAQQATDDANETLDQLTIELARQETKKIQRFKEIYGELIYGRGQVRKIIGDAELEPAERGRGDQIVLDAAGRTGARPQRASRWRPPPRPSHRLRRIFGKHVVDEARREEQQEPEPEPEPEEDA